MKNSITLFVLLLVCKLASAQFAGGDGTPGNPYQITTPAELNNVRNYLGNSYAGTCFQLMNDINLTGYLAVGGDGYAMWGAAGWNPIGHEFSEFYGQFDGNYFSVAGLNINRNEYYVGLFGAVKNGGCLRNIWVEIDPAGSITGNAYVGALVGQNYGTVSYCYTLFGSVIGGYAGNMLTGGLVGQNDGCILNSFAMVDVSGSWSVGGLVGYNHSGTISNCFARGSVSLGGNLGGLVGANGGTINTSFATGLVGGGTSGGGLVASNTGTVDNCYWDIETSGRTTSSGSDPSYGKLTTEMKTKSTFAGWDFTAPVWTLGTGNNNNYPFLSSPVQASKLIFSDVQSTRMTIGWTKGNETKRAVFMKQASTGSASPDNNTNYSPNPVFGNGTQIRSTGWYCVYNGNGNGVTVTGLTLSTDYIVQVFEYQDPCGAKFNPFPATDNPLSQATAGPPPIEVTATEATPGPTLYTNLKAAFKAINDGIHQGAITVKIIGNSIEPATALLYESSPPSNYTSVNIYPTQTGLSISGNVNAPLIDLSGADYVTINGSLNGLNAGKDLTIVNTSTADTGQTSTIRFFHDAYSNLVKYCIIKGSTTDIESGVVCFGGSRNDGNDENTIDHNDITNANDNRPVNAVYSNGSSGGKGPSGPGDVANSEDHITNNHIFDFLSPDYSSSGILIEGNSTAWSITGNSFYETTLFVPTNNTGLYYDAIDIFNPSGNDFLVSGNFIGGNSPACNGTMTINGNVAHYFAGIYMEVGTIVASSVQNNTIKNIDYTFSSESNTPWCGIYVDEGTVNIGTISGNTIGSTTSTGSILVTNTNNNWRANTYGIFNWSGGIVDIEHNMIGGITTSGDAAQAHNFYGIINYGTGLTTISNNTIGSTTIANSINASSESTDDYQDVFGINHEGGDAVISGNTISNLTNGTTNSDMYSGSIIGIRTREGTGVNTITNNTISGLTIGDDNSASSVDMDDDHPSIVGISQESLADGQTITGNTIYNLSNSYPSFEGSVIGIYYMGGASGTNNVSKNFIHDLSVTGASSITASLYGIKIDQGTSNYFNNIVSLGGNSATDIYGIYEYGQATDFIHVYYNTVYIGGTLGSGVTNLSYALFSAGIFNSADFIDNIFHNARSTNGGSNLHFAAYFVSDGRAALTCDYNDYFVSGTGGMLGSYTSSTNSLPIVTGQDIHSLNTNPNFATPGGSVAANYIPAATLNGIVSAGYPATDYAGTTRAVPPTMGALEKLSCSNPTNGGTISANQAGCNPFDPALITCSDPSGQTGILEYKWQSSTDNLIFVDIPGATSTSYNPDPLTATTWYKRIARVTCMGNWTGAAETTVAEMTVNDPVSAAASVLSGVSCFGGNSGSAAVSASGGSSTYSYSWNTTPVQNTVVASGLTAGIYQVTVTDANTCTTTATVEITQPSAALAAGISTQTNIRCFGSNDGSATVTVSGGTSGYSYLWNTAPPQFSNVASALSAGTFTVTITDANSCTTSASVTISQPAALYADISSHTDITCHGTSTGTATVSASGGKTPYSYHWNNSQTTASVTGLSAGTYSVTVTDANTCPATATVQITQPAVLTAGIMATNVQCAGGNNGSATVTVSGGTTPYSYLWNNTHTSTTITGLSAGNYTVTVTDLCMASVITSVSITQPAAITVNAGPDQSLCQENYTYLYGDPASGSWSETSGPNPVALFPIPATNMTLVMGILMNDVTPYVFRYTVTVGACSNFDEMQLFNRHYPSVPYAGPDQSVCAKPFPLNFVTMAATTPLIGTGIWTPVAGTPPHTIVNIMDPKTQVEYTIPGVYKFLWTVSNGSCDPGGLNADTCVIRVYAPPVVYAGPDAGVCGGGSYYLSGSTASSDCMTLLWTTSGTGSFSDAITLHPIYSPSSSDIAGGCVTLTLTGTIGCCNPCGPATVSDVMTLCFYPKPNPTAFVLSNVTCNGYNNGSVTVTVSGGTTPYSYAWSNGQTTQTITGLGVDTYTVTVTDAHSCTGTSSVSITQPTALSILSHTISNIGCYSYSTGSISITVGGGTTPYTYLWSNSKTTSSITGLSAGTYTVTVSDAHTCTLIQSWQVTQPDAWSIGISGPQTVCCNLSSPYTTAVYTATVGGSYLPPVTYQWVVEGGTILSGWNTNTITVSWACCGTGKVWLTVTDSKPCTLTTFIPVTINPTPAPVITGPAEVTAGESNTQYCTPDYAGHLYTWTVIGGSVTSGQGTHCITVTWGPYPSCGCGSVTVAETYNGCTGIFTLPVSIIPGVTVSISGYMSYDNDYATKLNGVTVQLRNTSNGIVGTTVTFDNPANGQPGYYAFTNIPDGTYHLTGSFDGTWGGNNATDALVVQLNIIGLYPLYDLRDTVADVNGSMTITGLDALYIKLRTIGTINSYPAGDWKILAKTVILSGGTPVTQDMIALCEGDVNGSYIPTGFKEATFLSQVDDGVMTVPVGEPFVYDIHSSRDAELGAMTLFMDYDQDRFEVTGIASKTDGMKYVYGDGRISIAWADTKPLKVNAGDELLSLNMRVKDKITEPARVFNINAGSEFADIMAKPYGNFDLKMSNVLTPGASQDVSMYNYPNPFANTTTIVYTLPEAGHAKLVLTDLYGTTIRTLTDQQEGSGSHSVTIDPAALNMAPGVYLYKIIFDSSTDTFVKVNKMIFTR